MDTGRAVQPELNLGLWHHRPRFRQLLSAAPLVEQNNGDLVPCFTLSMRRCISSRQLLLNEYALRGPTRTVAAHCLASTTTTSTTANVPRAVAKLSPRWLFDVKERLGKCMTFGLNTKQTEEAGSILRTISNDWRELVAGSEGYLTSKERCGLHRYPIAWGEQDPMAHINNIVYNRWAESGRIAWARNFAALYPEHSTYWLQLMIPQGEGLILRKITTEYKFPMKFPDRVSVYHKLTLEPDDSDAFLLTCVILSEKHQRVAARTIEDIALYDYDRARKVNKQPWLVNLLKETWRQQEAAKEANTKRVTDLLSRIRQLELASWDRVDAVEDMGSSSS